MKTAKRVAIYARYSTEMQSKMSIRDQLEMCQRFALNAGWTVVEEYSDEQQSSASNKRPDYQRMLADLGSGKFDVILAEAMDRISRDQEDCAHLLKRAKHADIVIHTLSEGELDTVRMTFIGLVGALSLEHLKLKTHRGLSGRVWDGLSAGGRSYGYRAARTEHGKPGALDIVEDEAIVVRRIFKEYADGKSPLQIAAGLNKDGVPSPAMNSKRKTSGHWKQNTINGNRARGTGILNNELYAGRRVWNRLRYSLEPVSRKRVSKLRPESEWEIHDVPTLRILEESLWAAAKSRQESLVRRKGLNTGPRDRNGLSASQALRRRKYLLSGLLECGICGGKLTIAGSGPKKRYYCANSKEKGPAVCIGMPGLLQHRIEEAVLSGLRSDLMQDAAYEQFRRHFESRMAAAAAEGEESLKVRDKLIREKRKEVDNLQQAILRGPYSASVITLYNETEIELSKMETERKAAVPPAIELPIDLPALYRAHIDNLVQTLSGEAIAGRASDEIHKLIDRIIVCHDSKHGHTVEILGELASMLGAADSNNAASYEAAACSLKLVAGAGFEPATFRL